MIPKYEPELLRTGPEFSKFSTSAESDEKSTTAPSSGGFTSVKNKHTAIFILQTKLSSVVGKRKQTGQICRSSAEVPCKLVLNLNCSRGLAAQPLAGAPANLQVNYELVGLRKGVWPQ